MRKPVVLITGAGGEIGHGLVARLSESGSPIITLDVSPLDASLAPRVAREFTGSITDVSLLERILAEFEVARVYFRCVRFPGLISAVTLPSGGTSDYAPEMIHAAAKRERYDCFVRPDT